MKTQQRFTYTSEGKKKIFLLLPSEYEEILDLIYEADLSLIEAAASAGLDTKRIDKESLRLQQLIREY